MHPHSPHTAQRSRNSSGLKKILPLSPQPHPNGGAVGRFIRAAPSAAHDQALTTRPSVQFVRPLHPALPPVWSTTPAVFHIHKQQESPTYCLSLSALPISQPYSLQVVIFVLRQFARPVSVIALPRKPPHPLLRTSRFTWLFRLPASPYPYPMFTPIRAFSQFQTPQPVSIASQAMAYLPLRQSFSSSCSPGSFVHNIGKSKQYVFFFLPI